MDRTDRVGRADAQLRGAHAVFERCLDLARKGDPYFVRMRPSIHAWQEAMGAWRCGTAGQKRVIALADEISRALATLEAGFEQSRQERRIALAAERKAVAAEAVRRDQAARADAQRLTARREAEHDDQGHSDVPTLFQLGTFDLRESGPG
jgi:hypothetical protein